MTERSLHDITLRHPCAADGAGLYRLIAANPPLDCNSRYAYQLLVRHFAETCAVCADADGTVVAAVTGYRLPQDPTTLFVWQMAVDPAYRGQGLGGRLLRFLLAAAADVQSINTTISPDNIASYQTFVKLAQAYGATIQREPFLGGDECGVGHDPEDLIIINYIKHEKDRCL